jgi:hypothetical protein
MAGYWNSGLGTGTGEAPTFCRSRVFFAAPVRVKPIALKRPIFKLEKRVREPWFRPFLVPTQSPKNNYGIL